MDFMHLSLLSRWLLVFMIACFLACMLQRQLAPAGLKSRGAWGSWVVLVLEMSDVMVLRQVYNDFVSVWDELSTGAPACRWGFLCVVFGLVGSNLMTLMLAPMVLCSLHCLSSKELELFVSFLVPSLAMFVTKCQGVCCCVCIRLLGHHGLYAPLPVV